MHNQPIHIGKVYELKTQSIRIQIRDSYGVPLEHCPWSHSVVGTDKLGKFQQIVVEDTFQSAMVLEKKSVGKHGGKEIFTYRCIVGPTDIWLGAGAFVQELTPKRVRQLAKSRGMK